MRGGCFGAVSARGEHAVSLVDGGLDGAAGLPYKLES